MKPIPWKTKNRGKVTFSSELNFVLLSYAGMSILRLIVTHYGDVGL
jgi:hypothetical protein